MKNKIYKLMATAFAMALVVASPAATITSHALGFNFDAPTWEDNSDPICDYSGSSSNSSSSGSSDSGSSSGNHDSGSRDNGNNHGFNADAPTWEDNSDPINTYSAPVQKNPNDMTVGVTGSQKFRIVMSNDHTTYQVYHCGIDRASFRVTDAEGNAVAYKTVALEQGEDNLWYANISFGEGVDTTSYTVAVTKGDANYLGTELNVSGIKINGTLVLSTVPATEEK